MRFLRSVFVALAAGAGLTAAAVACEDSSPGGVSPDASSPPISVDGGGTPDTQAPPANTTTTPDASVSDSGDAGLKGTALGLRVKFIGNEHSYGVDDESSLTELFAGDTTLTPTRAATVATLDAAFLADADVIVLDVIPRMFTEAEAQALYDWVKAGHGIISLTGFGASNPTTDSLLVKFGVGYSGSTGGNLIVPTTPGHAVVNGVSGLRFYGGHYVTSTLDASVVFGKVGDNAIGMATQHELGRSVIFGDDWILLDQEVNRTDDAGAFPTRTFWRNALLWAGGRID